MPPLSLRKRTAKDSTGTGVGAAKINASTPFSANTSETIAAYSLELILVSKLITSPGRSCRSVRYFATPREAFLRTTELIRLVPAPIFPLRPDVPNSMSLQNRSHISSGFPSISSSSALRSSGRSMVFHFVYSAKDFSIIFIYPRQLILSYFTSFLHRKYTKSGYNLGKLKMMIF